MADLTYFTPLNVNGRNTNPPITEWCVLGFPMLMNGPAVDDHVDPGCGGGSLTSPLNVWDGTDWVPVAVEV